MVYATGVIPPSARFGLSSLYAVAMCGRFAQAFPRPLKTSADLPASILETLSKAHARYNIAPSQNANLIRSTESGVVELARLKWGLLPSWQNDLKRPQPINARIETVNTSAVFREAWRKRHIALPVSGYYEWVETNSGKQPYYFQLTTNEPLWLAGIWETWERPELPPAQTFAIITREAEGLPAQIHNRMPAYLTPNSLKEWLFANGNAAMAILIQDVPDLAVHPVSKRANTPRNDDPEVITSITL